MAEDSIMYRDWLKLWLSEKKGRVKDGTRANYSVAAVNHIIPRLGGYHIGEVTEERLQEAVLFWLRAGTA